MSIYGLIITLGIFTAIFVARRLVMEKGMGSEILWDGIFWVVLSGLVGARIFHVMHLLPYYWANPGQILAVWNGGMGVVGGLIGGGLALVLYLKRAGQNVWKWLDIAGVVVPLGQAVGRWGNYFNQEIFGSPTAMPWGIFIDASNRPVGMESFERFHPLFLYESVLCLGLFIFLYALYKKQLRAPGKKTSLRTPTGRVFWFYLLGYCVIRFFLEFLRAEPSAVWQVGELNVVQVICGFIVVAALSRHYRLTKTLE